MQRKALLPPPQDPNKMVEPKMGIEPMTSSLPKTCSTTEPLGHTCYQLSHTWPNVCNQNGGGPSWIRTSEGVSQQIYSLPRLATSVPTHMRPFRQRGVLYGAKGEMSNGICDYF